MMNKVLQQLEQKIIAYEKKTYSFFSRPQVLLDIAYKYILLGVSLIIGYEIFTRFYSFSRAIWLFVIISIIYLFYKYKSSQISLSHPIINILKNIYAYINKNKESLFHLSFILFFIIFITSLWFNQGDLFIQYVVFFLLLYVVYKMLGGKISYDIARQNFFSTTFLQILIIFLALSYAAVFRLVDIFGISVYQNKIIAFVGVGGVVLLSYLFSNISSLMTARKTKVKLKNFGYKLLLDNIRLILTLFIFAGVGIWLLYSNDVLDLKKYNLFTQQEVETETIEPVAKVPELPRVEVPIETETFIIGDRYTFNGGLQVGSEGEAVSILQEYLINLGYYTGDISGVFDEPLRLALRNTLIENCEWPESTLGILGAQASACINSLEITREIEVEEVAPERVQQLISNEVQ